MLDLIMSEHHLDDYFEEIPTCFYDRNLDLEKGFCMPFRQDCHGNVVGRLFHLLASKALAVWLTGWTRNILYYQISGILGRL